MENMKYRVINHTTLEILDTDDITVAFRWMAEWKEQRCNVEMIDNNPAKVIVDTRKGADLNL